MKKRLLHNNTMTPEEVRSYAMELLPITDVNTLISILNSLENALNRQNQTPIFPESLG